MRLKTILISALLCGGIFPPAIINADNVIIKTDAPSSHDPRDTGEIIEYNVCNGVLTFLPSIFYDTLFVTIESDETGDMWCGVITPENRTMVFTNESGSYTLTCVTEDGTEYSSIFIQ